MAIPFPSGNRMAWNRRQRDFSYPGGYVIGAQDEAGRPRVPPGHGIARIDADATLGTT